MGVTAERLLALRAGNEVHSYSERDTMLYALGVGFGRDPLDRRELDFVYERRERLRAVPSQAVTVARQNLIFDVGLNVPKMLHGEQKLTLHRPLPAATELLADHRVVQLYDKGEAKGLMIEMETRTRLRDGSPLFDIYNLYYARGDGGIGGSTQTQRLPHSLPARLPDIVRTVQTLPWQALLYRLTGDRNVIHGDPDIAREMGFKAPILHGSGTMGVACRELLAAACDYEPARIKTLGARFTSVVYPGERLETDIWIDGVVASFRLRVPERGVVVLDNGICEFAAE